MNFLEFDEFDEWFQEFLTILFYFLLQNIS